MYGRGGGGNGLGGGLKSGGSRLIVPNNSSIDRDPTAAMADTKSIVKIHRFCDSPANFLPSSNHDASIEVVARGLSDADLNDVLSRGTGDRKAGLGFVLGSQDPVDTPLTNAS